MFGFCCSIGLAWHEMQNEDFFRFRRRLHFVSDSETLWKTCVIERRKFFVQDSGKCVSTNPCESVRCAHESERIRTNPNKSDRTHVDRPPFFGIPAFICCNESEFYTVCGYIVLMCANGVKLGFVRFVWKLQGNSKFQGRICSDSFRFFGFVRIRSDL